MQRNLPNYNAQPTRFNPSGTTEGEIQAFAMRDRRINQPPIYQSNSQRIETDPMSTVYDRPAETMRRFQSNQEWQNLAAPSVKDRAPGNLHPEEQIEDLAQKQIQIHERLLKNTEPIFRAIAIVCNTRYSNNSAVAASSFEWNIGRQFVQNVGGNILANEEMIENISAIEIGSFYIPASQVTSGDIYEGTLNIRFGTIDSLDNGSSEYSGPSSSISTHRKQFVMDVDTTADPSGLRYKLTPRNAKVLMNSPVTPSGNKWTLSINSWLRSNIIFLPPVITGVLSATNPMNVLMNGHGVFDGEQVTIDLAGLGLVYIPYSQAFTATVVDANNFTLNVDGTGISGTPVTQLTNLTRVIYVNLTLYAQDKKSSMLTSNRATITM